MFLPIGKVESDDFNFYKKALVDKNNKLINTSHIYHKNFVQRYLQSIYAKFC